MRNSVLLGLALAGLAACDSGAKTPPKPVQSQSRSPVVTSRPPTTAPKRKTTVAPKKSVKRKAPTARDTTTQRNPLVN